MTANNEPEQGGSGASVDLTGWTSEGEKRVAQRCMQALKAMLAEAGEPEVLIILLDVDSFWHTASEVEKLTHKEVRVDLFAYQSCGVSWFCANPGNDESNEIGMFACISSPESFYDDPATATWVQALVCGEVVDMTLPSLKWQGNLELRRQLHEIQEPLEEFGRTPSGDLVQRMASLTEALVDVPLESWADAGLMRPRWL